MAVIYDVFLPVSDLYLWVLISLWYFPKIALSVKSFWLPSLTPKLKLLYVLIVFLSSWENLLKIMPTFIFCCYALWPLWRERWAWRFAFVHLSVPAFAHMFVCCLNFLSCVTPKPWLQVMTLCMLPNCCTTVCKTFYLLNSSTIVAECFGILIIYLILTVIK